MSVTALLHQVPIFAELDEATLQMVADRCVTRHMAAGSLLFSAGETCRGLYIVASGRVRIFRTSPEGKEQVLHVEGPGRTVAELPLFDGEPYPASAMTAEPSSLVFLARADFERLYRSSPDIAQTIVRALGKRLRHLVHVTETLAFRDVAARLALLIAGLADESAVPTAAGAELALARSQRELALEIGAARESVSRALKQLAHRGLIIPLGGDRLRIPDVERLRTFARQE
jgi:CRP/FNR family transcriptional regulator, cyclic AMP receptor protein